MVLLLSLPDSGAGRGKIVILFGFVFLAFAGACGWIYVKEYILAKDKQWN
jgi:hypothetical protein